MEFQEKIATIYFFESTHKENQEFIIRDYCIRKGFKIDFKWALIDIAKYKIVFNQN